MTNPAYTPNTLAIMEYLDYDTYRTESSYRTSLRGIVRGLWTGQVNISEASQMMESTVRRGFVEAFNEGLVYREPMGERPEDHELTQEELTMRDDRIAEELSHSRGLLEYAVENNKETGAKLEPLFSRVELWVARYREMRHFGRLVSNRDKRLVWRYDPSKENCVDCLRLNGKVYYGRTWLKYNLKPQSAALACYGSHCGCNFFLTDDPVTRGRPPALRGPKR